MAYLIIIPVFIIYLIGIICNKDWAVRPAGHYSGWHVIEDFLGRTGLRIYSQWPPYPLSYRIAFLSIPAELLALHSRKLMQVSFLQCTMIRPQVSSPYQ